MYLPEEYGVITWEHMRSILLADNHLDLELEIAKRKNDLSKIIRPLHAPKKETAIHEAVLNKAINCLRLLLRSISLQKNIQAGSRIMSENVNNKKPDDHATRYNKHIEEMRANRLPQFSYAHDTAPASSADSADVNLELMRAVSALDEPDAEGKTPLHFAVELGSQGTSSVYAQFTRMLLDVGAYVNVRDKCGKTPAHYLMEKCGSVETSELDSFFQTLKVVLSNKDYDRNAKTFSNYSAVELLKESVTSREVNRKRIQLKEWIEGRMEQIRKGERLDQLYKTDGKMLRTLLTGDIISCNYNKATDRILSGLKSYSDVNFNWYIGTIPFIIYVTTFLDSDCVSRILELGANPWIIDSSHDKLALHAALERGYFKSAEKLLHYMYHSRTLFGCDLTAVSFTLLQKAICNNNINGEWDEEVSFPNCLRLMLKSPLNFHVEQRRSLCDHTTVLDLAMADGNSEAIRLIKMKGGTTSSNLQINGELSACKC